MHFCQCIILILLVSLIFNKPWSFMSAQRKLSKILWREGPTTTAFVTHTLPFFQEKRFKINSIYPLPQVKNLSKNRRKKSKTQQIAQTLSKSIDMQQKNQKRMKGYKKQKRGSKDNLKQHHKHKSYGSMPDTTLIHIRSTINSSKQSDDIISRLYITNPMRMSNLRDRSGIRREFFLNQEDEIEMKLRQEKKFIGKSKGFSTTKRINLKLPLTYNPGPGAYELKRQFEDSASEK